MQNARENPLAAAAATAAISGTEPSGAVAQSNVENLLDIDFDGGAPASAEQPPSMGMSGLEGLAGTPQRVESPAARQPAPPRSQLGAESVGGGAGNLDDLMGVFGNGGGAAATSAVEQDMMNGFGGLDLMGSSNGTSSGGAPKKTNDDILGLF